MKKVTARALEKSIQHWDRLATNKTRRREVPYADDCALCDRFTDSESPDEPCVYRGERCPIYLRTGRPLCYETPYYRAAGWYEDLRQTQRDPFLTSAAEMRDFLISLREIE